MVQQGLALFGNRVEIEPSNQHWHPSNEKFGTQLAKRTTHANLTVNFFYTLKQRGMFFFCAKLQHVFEMYAVITEKFREKKQEEP